MPCPSFDRFSCNSYTLAVLWTLLQQQVLRFRRSSTLSQRVATLGLGVLFGYLPILALVILIGVGLPFLFAEQGADVVARLESGILPGILLLAPVAAYLHRQLPVNPTPFLVRPVSRSTLVVATTLRSSVNLTQMGVALVLVSTWASGILPRVPVRAAIGSLAAWLACLALLHLIAQMLRALLHHSLLGFVAVSALVLGGLIGDIGFGTAATASLSQWLLEGCRSGSLAAGLVLVGSLTLGSMAAYTSLRRLFYLDRMRSRRSGRASRGVLRILPPMLRTDLRLFLRTTRMRMLLLNAALFTLLAGINTLNAIQGDASLLWFNALFMIPLPALLVTLPLGRSRCRFADGLSTRPSPDRAKSRSALRIADGFVLAGAAVVVPLTLALKPSASPLILSTYLYTFGVANVYGVFMGGWLETPHDPNAGMFDMQGTPGGNEFGPTFAANLLCAALPAGLAFLAPSPTGWQAWVPLLIAGALGLAARRVLLQRIAARHRGRRYGRLERFREV